MSSIEILIRREIIKQVGKSEHQSILETILKENLPKEVDFSYPLYDFGENPGSTYILYSHTYLQ